MSAAPLPELNERIARAAFLLLFLDYDGTLADFAPTPDDILPDPEIINLVQRLVHRPATRVAVVSGRRLSHIQALLPVDGLVQAGTYGIELYVPGEGRSSAIEYAQIRPVLDKVKPVWQALLAGRQGFYLEDKGWALALHARFANDEEAAAVLAAARAQLPAGAGFDGFRVLGGHKFLEVGPRAGNKGRTVAHLMERFRSPGMLPVYVGDDDKDEEAFDVVSAHGGAAVVVAAQPRPTQAQYRLESPQEALRWLASLI